MVRQRCQRYLAHIIAESRKELGEADLMAFVKGIIAPLALTTLGLIGVRFGLVVPGILLAASGWLGLAALWLIIVPSRIWEEQCQRLTPRIAVGTPTVQLDRWQRGVVHVHIPVLNRGAERILECEAQVIGIEPDILQMHAPFYVGWASGDGGGRHASFQDRALLFFGYARRGEGNFAFNTAKTVYVGQPIGFYEDFKLSMVISASNSAPETHIYRLRLETPHSVDEVTGESTILIDLPPVVTFEEVTPQSAADTAVSQRPAAAAQCHGTGTDSGGC
ncbi:MAG: hypothetical protein WEC75_07175 [Dehalococcoidia bacterium]